MLWMLRLLVILLKRVLGLPLMMLLMLLMRVLVMMVLLLLLLLLHLHLLLMIEMRVGMGRAVLPLAWMLGQTRTGAAQHVRHAR
jgi:hypothetical protein